MVGEEEVVEEMSVVGQDMVTAAVLSVKAVRVITAPASLAQLSSAPLQPLGNTRFLPSAAPGHAWCARQVKYFNSPSLNYFRTHSLDDYRFNMFPTILTRWLHVSYPMLLYN